MINDQDSLQGVGNIQQLIDDARYYQVVRNLRWPNGIITCTRCDSENVIKHGYHNTEPERRRYHCNDYERAGGKFLLESLLGLFLC